MALLLYGMALLLSRLCVFHDYVERKMDQFVSFCLKFSAKKLQNKFSRAAVPSLNMA
jgi:hypothetical protein